MGQVFKKSALHSKSFYSCSLIAFALLTCSCVSPLDLILPSKSPLHSNSTRQVCTAGFLLKKCPSWDNPDFFFFNFGKLRKKQKAPSIATEDTHRVVLLLERWSAPSMLHLWIQDRDVDYPWCTDPKVLQCSSHITSIAVTIVRKTVFNFCGQLFSTAMCFGSWSLLLS